MSESRHHDGTADLLPGKVYVALDKTDDMSPDLRLCVHEFSYAVVSSFVNSGIQNPNIIRALVHACWMGARQPHQRQGQRGAYKGNKSPVSDHLDWILLQAGSQISAATLLRVLALHNLVIVPQDPNSVMVEASMDAVKHMGTVDKYTKHRNRLRAAIKASAARMWPQLVDADK